MKKRPEGAKVKIRRFLEENVGKVVTTHQISEVAGIKDYQRRIRELRDEEGMQIRSYKDYSHLKPNEYFLESTERQPIVSRTISKKMRVEIFERNGFTCQYCGATKGDPDPYCDTKKLTLHIDHKIPIAQGGKSSKDNLRVLCSACNAGRSNIQMPTETARNILAQIRKLSREDKKQVFEALKKSYDSNNL